MIPFRTENIAEIITEFAISGAVASITEIKTGATNNTYHLQNTDATLPDYLLQRINQSMFKSVPKLMQNILKVTEHIKTKLPVHQAEIRAITLVKLKDGDLFHKDHDGNYWRMYHFIKGTKSYDKAITTQQAYTAGLAFGGFQSMLSDLDANELYDTIPGLHDVKYRLDDLEEAWNNNLLGRAKDVRAEIDFIGQREDAMCEILRLGDDGLLPWRITHNDARFINLLLDRQGNAQCVIDLDTVMPGYIAYDFGEAVRNFIYTYNGDGLDLAQIELNIPLFEAFTKGYLEAAKGFLTPMEIESLIIGVKLMPFIWATRFLTDHLNGDIEFNTQFNGQNLQRARVQIQLLTILEAAEGKLRGIIDKYKS